MNWKRTRGYSPDAVVSVPFVLTEYQRPWISEDFDITKSMPNPYRWECPGCKTFGKDFAVTVSLDHVDGIVSLERAIERHEMTHGITLAANRA